MSTGELSEFLNKEWDTVKEISIISEMDALQADSPEAGVRYSSEEIENFTVQVEAASGEKCERCWTRSTTVGEEAEHPQICSRCTGVLREMGI